VVDPIPRAEVEDLDFLICPADASGVSRRLAGQSDAQRKIFRQGPNAERRLHGRARWHHSSFSGVPVSDQTHRDGQGNPEK